MMPTDRGLRGLEIVIMLAIIALITALVCSVFGKPYGEYRQACCEWPGCAEMEDLQVHHVIPQTVLKDLNLKELVNDPRNLVTLCQHHHFVYAHLCDYSIQNLRLIDMMNAEREHLAAGGIPTNTNGDPTPTPPVAIHSENPNPKGER